MKTTSQRLRKILIILVVLLIGVYEDTQAQAFGWAKQLRGTGDQTVTASDLDAAENLYVCGVYGGTIDVDPGSDVSNFTGSGYYFAKYDNGGNLMWAKSLPNGGFLRNITGISYSASDNSIVVVGIFDVFIHRRSSLLHMRLRMLADAGGT